MDLRASHPDADTRREKLKLVALRNLTGNERPGNDCAKTFHRECAINWQTHCEVRRPGWYSIRDLFQVVSQLAQSFAGTRTDCHNWCACKKGAGHKLPRLVLNQRQHLFFNQVLFGDYHNPFTYSQQATDVEVFASLGHHSFVGRDYQGQHVDAMRACEHVFDKAFMTWNVDEPERDVFKLEISKAQVDRDAASLFFRKAIRIS